jgi:hypothetical protein
LRSSAAIQPAAQMPPSYVVALTCGTWKESRVIVTPEAEALALELVEEVRVADLIEERGEGVVHERLAVCVRCDRQAAELARGDDVARRLRVVAVERPLVAMVVMPVVVMMAVVMVMTALVAVVAFVAVGLRTGCHDA